jgi:SAM-dependent methyltransferase
MGHTDLRLSAGAAGARGRFRLVGMLGAMDSIEWDRRYGGRELLWTGEPNRFLVAETAALRPGSALDLACGEGRNAVWLAEQGWRVTGVDFSEVALEKARGLADARGVDAGWVAADLLDYRPEKHAFDLVILFYLQVPAAERRAVVRAAAEAVAPGGIFLLVAHDRANLERGYGGPQEPAVLYTAEDVVADLDGLRVERAERVERPVQTPDGERVALDALVRAVRVGYAKSVSRGEVVFVEESAESVSALDGGRWQVRAT